MTAPQPQHPDAELATMTLDERRTGDIADGEKAEQIVNPFEIVAADEYGIDYDKLINKFGTRKIDQEILDRFERLTGHKPHRYLRRGHFFSQRYHLGFLLTQGPRKHPRSIRKE
jgi:tryptophanyl-tRNA synthetase